jgi:hypothetical protein
MRKISILAILIILITGCKTKTPIDVSFYYWKTDYKNNVEETKYLDTLKSKSLYVRIMDVDFDTNTQQIAPVSPIKFSDQIPSNLNIIPVVFIVNNVFYSITEQQIEMLANKISYFVDSKVKQAGKNNYTELQIDCDWTEGTKKNYFKFLKLLQANTFLKAKLISVTLRLHQVKNIVSSGIPPVKKVMLMCYNMGNLRKFGAQNSILNQQDMDTYLKDHLKSYPLKLDVALPLFNWAVVFRNEKYAGISKRISNTDLEEKTIFKRKPNTLLYELLTNYPKAGLKKGDLVRIEKISADDLFEASRFLSRYLPAENRNLVFYHLDSNILKNFTNEDLQKIIDNF